MNKEQLEFLKELQSQMLWEDENDYDCQASPRFWTLMDYRKVPGNEEYDDGEWVYFHGDGDVVEFESKEDLVEFMYKYYDDNVKYDNELRDLLTYDIYDLSEVIEYLIDEDYDFFDKAYMVEEEYIVQNTLFLTKKEAKKYINMYSYNHSPKIHTYAMSALRSPSIEKLYDILHTVDFDKIKLEEDR